MDVYFSNSALDTRGLN